MPEAGKVRRELLAERRFARPGGAEIINRIPRRSVDERGWPEAGAVELVAVTEFIRRFGPVRESVPVRPSSEPHDLQCPHRWLWSQ